jgi:hypothetical protein
LSLRKYKSQDIVEKIAIEKYRENGLGITFQDIQREFSVSKSNAQQKLKHFHGRKVLFTAKDLILEGIPVLENTNPQHYFPTSIRSEIIKGRSKQKNVLIGPTGVNHPSTPLSSGALNTTDEIVLQTLEGHILHLLPAAPLYLHNIHLKTSVTAERYEELDGLLPIAGNKGKKHTQIIGTSKVDYTLYPSGTANVEVSCSNNPFRIQEEENRSHLLIFLGQIRQVLISILSDRHERFVPDVLKWEVTECDINKDIKVSDWFQFIGYKVQVKHLDHLFRIYIKPMGKETVCRVEQSLHPKKSALETINDIFNPMEKLEKLFSEKFERLFAELREKPAIQDFDNSIPTSQKLEQHYIVGLMPYK